MKSDDLIEEIWERREKKRSYFEPRKGIFGDLTDFKRKKKSNKSKLNSKSKINNFSQYLEKPQNAPIQLAKPTIKDVGNSLLIKESEDSLSFDDGITFHFHGKFNAVNSCWQREKCKDLGLNYTLGIIYENEATNKALEIRRLVPSREKRISPDGNCLFRSLSFVITGTDYNHQLIRELIVNKVKGEYREQSSKYCNAHNDLLPESKCQSVEEYLKISMMDCIGSWGTDLEIFLMAQILRTDIFVYKDDERNWMKFSGYGFNDRHSVHELTESRIYLRLYMSHFQPVVKVKEIAKFSSK